MAEKDSKPGSPIKDFGWLALFLIALGVIWFAQGGPSRLSSITAPFLEGPSFSSGTSNGNSSRENNSLNQAPLPGPEGYSPYKGKVNLSVWNSSATDPQQEYIEIRLSSDIGPLSISDWTVEGIQGLKLNLGRGANLFFLSQPNPQDPIILQPSGTAVVVSGQSPVGSNFRLNICTGYFNQFQTFYPYLSEECPRIDEKEISVNYPDACFNYIRSLGNCRMPVNAIPMEVGNDCTNFITQRASYNGCVTKYKNEKNFYKNEWRVYLNRNTELWQKRDIITLRDQNGKIIESIANY